MILSTPVIGSPSRVRTGAVTLFIVFQNSANGKYCEPGNQAKHCGVPTRDTKNHNAWFGFAPIAQHKVASGDYNRIGWRHQAEYALKPLLRCTTCIITFAVSTRL